MVDAPEVTGGGANVQEVYVRMKAQVDEVRAALKTVQEGFTGLKEKMEHVHTASAKVNQGFRQANEETVRMRLNFTNLASAAGRLVNVYDYMKIGLQAAVGVTAASFLLRHFNEMVQVGERFNQQLERTQLGLQAIAAGAMDLRDATGQQVDAATKFAAASGVASVQIEKLRVDSMGTLASFTQLAGMYQRILPMAQNTGASMDQTRQALTLMVKAASTFGMSVETVEREIRYMLMGVVSMRSPLLQALGITREQARAWKESGDTIEELVKRLEKFAPAAAKAGDSFAGVKNAIGDIKEQIFGAMVAPMMETQRRHMIAIRDWLGTVRNGVFEFNDAIKVIITSVSAGADIALKVVYASVGAIKTLLTGGGGIGMMALGFFTAYEAATKLASMLSTIATTYQLVIAAAKMAAAAHGVSFASALLSTIGTWNLVAVAIGAVVAGIILYKMLVPTLADKIQDAAKHQGTLTKEMARTVNEIDNLAKAREKLRSPEEQQKDQREYLNTLVKDFEELAPLQDKATVSAQELEKALGDVEADRKRRLQGEYEEAKRNLALREEMASRDLRDKEGAFDIEKKAIRAQEEADIFAAGGVGDRMTEEEVNRQKSVQKKREAREKAKGELEEVRKEQKALAEAAYLQGVPGALKPEGMAERERKETEKLNVLRAEIAYKEDIAHWDERLAGLAREQREATLDTTKSLLERQQIEREAASEKAVLERIKLEKELFKTEKERADKVKEAAKKLNVHGFTGEETEAELEAKLAALRKKHLPGEGFKDAETLKVNEIELLAVEEKYAEASLGIARKLEEQRREETTKSKELAVKQMNELKAQEQKLFDFRVKMGMATEQEQVRRLQRLLQVGTDDEKLKAAEGLIGKLRSLEETLFGYKQSLGEVSLQMEINRNRAIAADVNQTADARIAAAKRAIDGEKALRDAEKAERDKTYALAVEQWKKEGVWDPNVARSDEEVAAAARRSGMRKGAELAGLRGKGALTDRERKKMWKEGEEQRDRDEAERRGVTPEGAIRSGRGETAEDKAARDKYQEAEREYSDHPTPENERKLQAAMRGMKELEASRGLTRGQREGIAGKGPEAGAVKDVGMALGLTTINATAQKAFDGVATAYIGMLDKMKEAVAQRGIEINEAMFDQFVDRLALYFEYQGQRQ